MRPTRTRVVASGLLSHDGGVLLLRRRGDFRDVASGRGRWEPPGGRVEIGEGVEACMRREVEEETGIRCPSDPQLLGVVDYVVQSEEKTVHRFHVIYAVELEAPPDIVLSDEHDAHRFVASAADLEDLPMAEALERFIADFLDRKR